ncbi:MAG: 2,3,4,5-tetrahydropyridine-2,6-dicarboxylate N-succinyltransferase [Gammaproteobacteria bacterium]|nr:2,3,4,5-tetrahydropyridine-2,6-dicarboxylate N-succinyltransferase [Gammaproteobacteria bacterium]
MNTKLSSLNLDNIQNTIEHFFEIRQEITPKNIPSELKQNLDQIVDFLNQGQIRTAEKINNQWHVHQWVKKAILLLFRANNNQIFNNQYCQYFDKLPLKYNNFSQEQFNQSQVRVVPNAIARAGCYIGSNTILMPSFVNIGAYIDTGCMIDTWATVGSCAQIGKNVHLSGGAGIGGVLEPLQANPTIIEDNCFIGARSEIVEGVIIGEGSVISMGVFIGQSTKIFNRVTKEITYGFVPPYSVVVPGSLPAPDNSHSLSCAIIIKQVDEKTRSKVSINELLRSFD